MIILFRLNSKYSICIAFGTFFQLHPFTACICLSSLKRQHCNKFEWKIARLSISFIAVPSPPSFPKGLLRVYFHLTIFKLHLLRVYFHSTIFKLHLLHLLRVYFHPTIFKLHLLHLLRVYFHPTIFKLYLSYGKSSQKQGKN